MRLPAFLFGPASIALLLGGCVSVPTGPSIMALPGAGKSFEQFRSDDAECRQYAHYQSGGADANQAAANAGIASAAVGTAVGALAGAAIGGNQQSAAAGAGTGLLFGAMAGTGAAQSSAHAAQRAYDHAYTQCMYAKGEQVAIPGGRVRSHAPAPAYAVPPPGAATPPPPPPGSPPPPR